MGKPLFQISLLSVLTLFALFGLLFHWLSQTLAERDFDDRFFKRSATRRLLTEVESYIELFGRIPFGQDPKQVIDHLSKRGFNPNDANLVLEALAVVDDDEQLYFWLSDTPNSIRGEKPHKLCSFVSGEWIDRDSDQLLELDYDQFEKGIKEKVQGYENGEKNEGTLVKNPALTR